MKIDLKHRCDAFWFFLIHTLKNVFFVPCFFVLLLLQREERLLDLLPELELTLWVLVAWLSS